MLFCEEIARQKKSEIAGMTVAISAALGSEEATKAISGRI